MTGRRFCAKEQLKPRGKSKLCKLQATSKQGVSDGDEAERTMSNPAKYDMWRPGAGTKGVLIHRALQRCLFPWACCHPRASSLDHPETSRDPRPEA